MNKRTFWRLMALLVFLVVPVLVLAGQFLQPAGIARGKSAAIPLSNEMTPEQQLAQELALADPLVQALTAGHRSEVFGVRQVLAGAYIAEGAACANADCRQVEIYNFDENAAVKVLVNLDTQQVLDVFHTPGEHPGINKRLADRAIDIAINAPEVIEALGYRPTNGTMAPVPGDLLDSSCDGTHLCAAPNFILEDRILWAVVDLTDDKLSGIAWTDILPDKGTSVPSLPEGCDPPGSVARDGWTLEYVVTGHDGLEVYNANYNGVEVLKSVKTVEWHADYGSTGFRDSTGCTGGGGGFSIYPYGPTHVNDLLDDQSNVIGFEVVQDFRMSSWGNTCNYRYDQHIQFFNDGRFRTVHGAYGKGCGTNATYRPVTRINIAVNGDDNDNFAYYDGANWVDLTTEDYRVPYTEEGHGPHELTPENYSWRVMDQDGSGFYLEQDIGQFPSDPPGRGAAPFLYASLHHPDEGDTDLGGIGACCNDDHLQGPDLFLNGENIENQNIVVWYVPQMVTDVTPGSYYCWTISGEPNPETYPCFTGPMFHPIDSTPGQAAQAGFTHDAPKMVGEEVSFTNTTTGTLPIDYLWEFGDGTHGSTVENPTHIYGNYGEYVVTLTAENDWGSSTYTDTVTINMAATVSEIIASATQVNIGESIDFSSDADGSGTLAYAWDFGDGNTSTDATPSHAYDTAGEYTVTLTVSNEFGSAEAEITITVLEENQPPNYLIYLPVMLNE